MDQKRDRLIHLHSSQSMTWKLLYKIMNEDPKLSRIYSYSLEQLQALYQLKSRRAQLLYTDLHNFSPTDLKRYYLNRNIQTVTLFDDDYPDLLKQIYDPPFVLYVLGKRHILSTENLMGVIGTRHPSQEGKKKVTYVVAPLIREGWGIVSGMAIGIDTIAHQQAIELNGYTIAVLGSGFNYVYPKENQQLFVEMSKHQCVVSEYPPSCPPNKWYFPARNRIISGLSKGIVVVEAREKSGSLITADQALEQGREVFSIPDSIFSQAAQGTNQLIQQGAKLILNYNDIIEEFK
ncbi:DNA-processing protein DprA [Bacillus suaedae]|uniref:DNA-processing protein DprA n=1 Tax=Halalkalibacter suaedae TaxID=2822140 RepID=A0A941ATK0_9BACI|nr:DNA-processing protein DprA [Bacillus suaedae]MBP3952049.1 DNA-processing protein DprA [Bacillus suaedae]